ncbi:MAG: sugar phosphate nucleotidyltransferase [Bacteroidales bacterium]|nr:sugar phosphate nucleotidyltransferase [Bacteroidales bacterium]
MDTQHCYCIILAGGIGRRLWPCSKRDMPKQFIDFLGTGRTLLQQTYDRFARFIDKDHILISTFEEYLPLVQEQLPEVPRKNILAEPVQLSTAPSAVWGSCRIGKQDPEANIVVSPSDHHIVNEARFEEQIRSGLDFVSQHEEFLAIGVKPTVPNTAYGYIQMGEKGKEEHMFRVKSFSEKPAPEYARMFVECGEFLWNTGIFLWHASTMFRHIEDKARGFSEKTGVFTPVMSVTEELEMIKKRYPTSLHRTLDLVILEKCENVYVQQNDFGWADVGSWPELYEVAEKDADGNAQLGKAKVLLSGCQNNLICLPEDSGAIIRGLDGYLVAQHGNQLVICPNDDPALVRRLANEAQIKLGDDFV